MCARETNGIVGVGLCVGGGGDRIYEQFIVFIASNKSKDMAVHERHQQHNERKKNYCEMA